MFLSFLNSLMATEVVDLVDPPDKQTKTPTLEELTATVKSQNDMINKMRNDNQKKNALIEEFIAKEKTWKERQLEIDEADKKAKADQGEYKDLFNDTSEKLTTEKELRQKLENDYTSLKSELIDERVHNMLVRKLTPKVNKSWVREGLDPVEKAIEIFPKRLLEFEDDEKKNCTNIDQVIEQFSKEFPGVCGEAQRRIAGPRGTQQPISDATNDMKVVAQNSKLPLSYVMKNWDNKSKQAEWKEAGYFWDEEAYKRKIVPIT